MKIPKQVIKGVPQKVAAVNQAEYLPLPYIRVDNREITRYQLSIWERLRVLFSGSIYLEILTSESFIHPRMVSVKAPDINQ